MIGAGIEILARQVVTSDFRTILNYIKRHNAFNMFLDIEPGLLPSFFKECRYRN